VSLVLLNSVAFRFPPVRKRSVRRRNDVMPSAQPPGAVAGAAADMRQRGNAAFKVPHP
jgi:hypothetical protein